MSNSEVKTHDEISDLLDSVKNVEENFSNLDFLQDLPDMVELPNKNISEPEITPEPEIPTETIQEIKKPQHEPPEHIKENQPNPIKNHTDISKVRFYVHNYLAKPIIGPPEPGHTTFTLELKNQNITGFHQPKTDTRSLKELAPIITTKIKTLTKTIKDRDFKKDIKNLKNLPTILKKQVSKISIDAVKTLPKKIRLMFSSD
ncbi:MAG: hypothetical protein KGY65_01470 [Candidatus Thermoplasmatota archaeon]|nr:hypothetical protein [Candidatus Thermoplasmatota archaeon]MBS3801398.1 hypothetical protein [Candidatus Thermoplasmatota archaeon]